MPKDARNERSEQKAQEALFHQRLAELRTKNAQFPWTGGEMPALEIPREESKLFADREVEGPDISDAELERRAMLDLTSISFNFKLFYKRLHYEIKRARRYQRPLSVCLVAIDRLDEIGLKIGSDAKTAAIEGAARTLLGAIRDVDIAGRCREDCFGVILPETGRSGAEIASERIRTKIEQYPVPHMWQSMSISASVGASSFPDNGQEVEELFAQAVEALMFTMKRGGNAVNFAGFCQ